MLIHSVYFWLKGDLDTASRDRFKAGLESLRSIEAATSVYVGTPADVPHRPVLEASYDLALVVLLKDLDAHSAYQADPVHQAFLRDCIPMTDRVRVFDPIDG